MDWGSEKVVSPGLSEGEVVRAKKLGIVTRELLEALTLQGFVGESPILLSELRKLPSYARSDACVLILGETGTGKELCARMVHYLGPRANGPFVALNAGAIPTELVENELFGHDAGAYTSARGPQRGLVAEAEGGTLFLDEIDSVPLQSQVKLLRFLQEKEYRPLGARRILAANVRVIAASNIDLDHSVVTGRFRKDLFYRVNVLPVKLPSLNERKEDISLLAKHFVLKHAKSCGGEKIGLAPEALLKLQQYEWPGNVRELENVVERAVVLSQDCLIRAGDIDLPVTSPPNVDPGAAGRETFQVAKARTVNNFERAYLQSALEQHHGNISQAARSCGKNRRAFFALMQKHRITIQFMQVGDAQKYFS
jgi:two-component system response regulator GlrR